MTAVDGAAFTASTTRWVGRGTIRPSDSLTGSSIVASSADVSQWNAWTEDAERSIKQLLLLDPGWDGEYALPVTEIAVAASQKLIMILSEAVPGIRPPFIGASIFGGVSLEWSQRGSTHIQFSAEPDGEVELLACVDDLEVEGNLFEVDRPLIMGVLEALGQHFSA